MFSKELNIKLDRYHLLKHPFYQIFWNEGKLTREIIKEHLNKNNNISEENKIIDLLKLIVSTPDFQYC